MKKIIILAGHREEFERYLADNGLTDSEVIYGYSLDRMAGIEASEVKEIGTFYLRKDAYDLREFANTRVR